MKRLVYALVLIPAPALAMPSPPPTPQEIMSQDKIQVGQLLIQLGQTELKLQAVQKELDTLKAKDAPAPKEDTHP